MAKFVVPGWPRVVPWGVAGGALALYMVTLAPGLTWQHEGADGGELVAAAYTMGVAHPPGYPLYLLLGKAFSLLPWGEVAFRLNLMSALFATGAVVLSYWGFGEIAGAAGASWRLCAVAGTVAALALATSPLLWSQALIAEVYTLNLFFLAAVAYCLLRWRYGGPARWLAVAALLAGLGLGNHLSLLLILPPAVVWLLGGRRIPGRVSLGAVAAFFLGLSIYLYLPWRAAQHPPINWGDASTWSGFWWLVSAAPYRALAFGLPLEHLPARLAGFSGLLGDQFQWWGLFLALLGLGYLWQRDRRWALFSASFGLLVAAYALMYNTTDSYIYLIPLVLVLSWGLGMGSLRLITWRAPPGGVPSRVGLASLTLGLLLVIPGYSVAVNYPALNLSRNRDAIDYARQVWQATEPNALILAGSDAHIFALWYFDVVEAPGSRRAVVAYPLLQYSWYRDQLQRREPEVLPPNSPVGYEAGLRALVEASLSRRPVYATEYLARELSIYSHIPEGPLWRLEPP